MVRGGYTTDFYHPSGGQRNAMRIAVPPPSPRDYQHPRDMPREQITPRVRAPNCGAPKGGGGKVEFQWKAVERDVREKMGLQNDLSIPRWEQVLRIDGEDINVTSPRDLPSEPQTVPGLSFTGLSALAATQPMMTPRTLDTPRTATTAMKTPRTAVDGVTPRPTGEVLDSCGWLRPEIRQENRMESEPAVPALTPRYISKLGLYATVDQNDNLMAMPASPRIPESPRVSTVRGISRVVPRLQLVSKTNDSLSVEWQLGAKPFPFGIFLCVDDGKEGAFGVCHFWSAADLREHMRENGRVPMQRVITNLKAASNYRLCLCEGSPDGVPLLVNRRGQTEFYRTAGTRKARPTHSHAKVQWKPKWKPSPDWEADYKAEYVQSPRYRFSQKRYGVGNRPQTAR